MTIYDTTINCPYPTKPIVTDSLFLTSGQIMLIEEIKDLEKKINIYPNPLNTFLLKIEMPEIGINKIILTDVYGREIQKFYNQSKELNIKGLTDGLYFLILETKQGIFKKKIIIENPNY